MKIKPDTYTIIARFFPSIIISLPILIIYFYLQELSESIKLVSFIVNLKLWSNITILIAFLYLLSQLIRLASKYFETKYFISEKGFPTTYFLSYKDSTYSKEFKDVFRKHLMEILDFKIMDFNEEKENPIKAYKLISEANDQIKVLIGEKNLVKYHNIWYGFMRNLIGGCIYGTIFSILAIFISSYYLKSTISIFANLICFLFYFTLLLFSRILLTKVAEDYAKKFLTEFLVYKKNV